MGTIHRLPGQASGKRCKVCGDAAAVCMIRMQERPPGPITGPEPAIEDYYCQRHAPARDLAAAKEDRDEAIRAGALKVREVINAFRELAEDQRREAIGRIRMEGLIPPPGP